MQLKTLMKLIKNNFMVDEQLRVFIYNDKIEFIDYTSPVELPNGEILKEFNGLLLTMYYRGNKIIAIEHHSLNLITPRNINLYKALCDLIDTEINDLKDYLIIQENSNKDLFLVL